VAQDALVHNKEPVLRTYVHEAFVPVRPEKLFAALANISRWPEWDTDLAATSHDGALAPGTPFTLKPKGGPTVSMTLEVAEAPRRFVDVSHLPLARMRTSHELEPVGNGTRLVMRIEVSGPLGWLWDRLIARDLAAGAEAQTAALARFAEEAS
jgi:hypothetical protein